MALVPCCYRSTPRSVEQLVRVVLRRSLRTNSLSVMHGTPLVSFIIDFLLAGPGQTFDLQEDNDKGLSLVNTWQLGWVTEYQL